MTTPQALSLGLVAATLGLFVWSRLPHDLVAVAALVMGVLTGVVPPDRAFSGFGDGTAVIVAAALLISAAIARSGAVEAAIRPVLRRLRNERSQVPVLAGAVALLSTAIRTTGALSTLIPVATRLSARTDTRRSALLVPMAFASVLGGLVTMVGTASNILIAKVRGDVTGTPFTLFDFLPAGVGVAVAGLLFLSFAWRLVPADRHVPVGSGEPYGLRGFTTEARIPADSVFAGRSVAELEAAGGRVVRVGLILRERFRRIEPTPDRLLRDGDVVLLAGEPDDLETLIAGAGLVLEGDTDADAIDDGEAVLEGVVTTGSPLAGLTVDTAELRARHGVAMLAISRRGAAVTRRLRFLRLQVGDVLILKGGRDRLGDAMDALRVLPLSERHVALGARRRSWAPIAILGAALTLVALGTVPVATAFAGAAVAVLLARAMTTEEAYRTIDWSLIVLIAALIPLSEAIRATGLGGVIAGGIAPALAALPPLAVLGLVLAGSMAARVWINGVATVLVLAPVAAALAPRLGLRLDPVLMAVAMGSACGFSGSTAILATPGSRPDDPRRLALPLSLIVIVAGTALIAAVWGLRAA